MKFYADCEGRSTSFESNYFNETNMCYGIETKEIRFKAEFTLTGDIPEEDVSSYKLNTNFFYCHFFLNLFYILYGL